MTWRRIPAAGWSAIGGGAWLPARFGYRLRARRRKRGTPGAAVTRTPMTAAEERLADTLLETAYAVPCPEDIAHFEESVEAMLLQRKTAGS